MRVSCYLLPSALIGNVLGWAGGDTRNVKDVPCFFQELAVNTAVFTLTGMLHNTICHCSSDEWPWTRLCSRPADVCTLARGAQKHYFAVGLKNHVITAIIKLMGGAQTNVFIAYPKSPREDGNVPGHMTVNTAVFTVM